EQAEEIARRVNALLLHGELSVRERDETLRRFRTAKTGVLVVTTVGDEGLDIPDVNIGIFVSGTGSRRQFIQRLGRLLRPAPGKKAVLYEVVVRGTSEEYQSKRRKELI
ncbi:MAG: helicase-related protein, partial [Acidilobaceae archaeon]